MTRRALGDDRRAARVLVAAAAVGRCAGAARGADGARGRSRSPPRWGDRCPPSCCWRSPSCIRCSGRATRSSRCPGCACWSRSRPRRGCGGEPARDASRPAGCAGGRSRWRAVVADVRQRDERSRRTGRRAAAWLRAERAPGAPTILDNVIVLPVLGYYDPAFRAPRRRPRRAGVGRPPAARRASSASRTRGATAACPTDRRAPRRSRRARAPRRRDRLDGAVARSTRTCRAIRARRGGRLGAQPTAACRCAKASACGCMRAAACRG